MTGNSSGTTGGTGSGTQRYSVPQTARLLGISERAVRKRIEAGTLQAERDGNRWIITLQPEPSEPDEAVPGGTEHGTGGGTEQEPSEPSGGTASEPIDVDYRVAVTEEARRQLETLRDTLLVPLIEANERQGERIAELEREAGRREAEHAQAERDRDAERERREAVEAERDRLREELQDTQARLRPIRVADAGQCRIT